ncbi:amino acid adenylation domain-containing protein [Dolichospermum circinale]|uniref:amino acid adenylation domain-containing protein n=1 Tax=Dolichospermum circinale TaxID=109265 RepID=UPI00232EC6BF|nr:amino acid adenylation domain-containing protein [Dolichospermum circinale]MDB9467605.1 amino acid adenylation domain-containing protein [Dolichospermum circinale CS-539/09]MDB9472281.1 amino acid adenylation domain-containing protein [Dolichospermum circinale CS-539]
MVTMQNSGNKTNKNIEAIYPLSSMQQGMLFHSLYNPESKAYLSQVQISLQGNLDILALEKAWCKVVERHPALRTLFVWKNPKQPLQIVQKQVNVPWVNLDWSSLSSDAQQEQLDSFCQSDQDEYFALDKAPLMRFTLIFMGNKNYELIWSSHHILADGWSLSVIMEEVWQFYTAINKGETLYLSPTRPYRDYIGWLQQQDIQQAEIYWRKNLQGFTATTPLQVDNLHRKKDISREYNHKYFSLSAEETASLKNLTQENYLTLFTLIQAAWGILLSRYSGEADIVFGATISGRPPALSGVESMVGLFVNTLPVRVKIPEDMGILSWLKQLQLEQIEREEYGYTPLVEIQGWSDIPRGQSLFESFVVFNNLPLGQELLQADHDLQIIKITNTGHADYPLTLTVTPEKELKLNLIYAGDRFHSETIERMIGHLQTLLLGIVANPHSLPGKLPLLTPQEQKFLLVDSNQTAAENLLQENIHELVTKWSEKTPDAVALVFADQKLTYGELNNRANQLAHYLQKLGVGADIPVGLCLERGLEVAIAILATLKAGGVCVPLDPNYSPERLGLILADTQVPVLITQTNLQGLLPCDFPHHRLILDQEWTQINLENKTNPITQITSENLAYIVYSSGSTGKPKGISVPHYSLTNLIAHHLAKMACGVGVLQFAPLSFDVSYHEIAAAWGTGGTLYLIPENTRLDLGKLMELLANNPIQKVILPVSLLQQLAEFYGQEIELFSNLREICAAGEQLQITQPMIDLFKQLKNCRLYNLYGPTEADLVTTYAFSENPEQWPVYAPIGKAAINVKVYILDKHFQPVPVGIVGELYVSGYGLAREYFQRPELTKEKFIPNPFDKSPYHRLYKTGDLARYLPDGNIEFLGRIDDLVKIRGYQIDLCEVEAILSKYPRITQAVITTHGKNAKEKFLVAYFIPVVSENVNTSELRKYLATQLPDYMIPSVFVQMDSFPLNPNGKVNRKVLPIPTHERPELNQIYIAPQTPIQEILTEIWAEVLGVKQVGIDDNFFQLGGHSLKAIQLIGKIRQTLELDITIRHLFNSPTVKELATVLGELAGGEEIINEIAKTIQEIAQLSPEQVQAMLAQQ